MVVVGDTGGAPRAREHLGLGAGGDVVGADDEPALCRLAGVGAR